MRENNSRIKKMTNCVRNLMLFLVPMSVSALGQTQDAGGLTIGTVQRLHSSVLGEDRDILVHLPQSSKGQRYPTLYVLDGEDHFESAVAITEQLSGVFPPMIVIGITNTVRQRDMTPNKGQVGKYLSKSQSEKSGGGDRFMEFISKELIPYIDQHYPTAPYRVLSGHSLGGLAALNMFFNRTATFNAFIVIDPSVWWDDQRWIKSSERAVLGDDFANKRLFIAIANNIPQGYDVNTIMQDKTGLAPVTQAILPFVDFLRQSKLSGLDWDSKFYPNERHGTVELNAEYDGLRYIFRDYQFRMRLFDEHPDWDQVVILKEHYRKVSDRMGYQVLPPEDMVNELAYGSMGSHKLTQALQLLLMNATNYPGSANAFDSLGDYYLFIGDKAKAIDAFTRSLKLGNMTETRHKLEALQKR